MNKAIALMFAFLLIACEGPMGPQGPPGEPGPQGPQGPTSQSILIEFPLSRFSYSEDGDIWLSNSRITPESFRSLFIKLTQESSRENPSSGSTTAYMPYTTFVSYMQQVFLSGSMEALMIIISAVSQGFSFEVNEDAEGLPQFAGFVVVEGGIEINDPDRILLEFADSMQNDGGISMAIAVLVQP